jgi:hypothetical protein
MTLRAPEGQRVHGLTTAACVWVTACIGVACAVAECGSLLKTITKSGASSNAMAATRCASIAAKIGSFMGLPPRVRGDALAMFRAATVGQVGSAGKGK